VLYEPFSTGIAILYYLYYKNNTSREVVFEATNSTFQNLPFPKMWVCFLESSVENNRSKISKDDETNFPQ
jgi:hypothetical protein